MLLTTACFQILAQKKELELIDSLKNVLAHTGEDTDRVNILLRINKEYLNLSSYEESRKYANEAMIISKKLNYKVGIINAYHLIGISYDYQGFYPEALKNYYASLKIKDELGDKKGIGNSYNNIGVVYYYQHNYEEGLKSHFTALKIRKEIADSDGIASTYNNIALIYDDQKKYNEALKYYLEAVRINHNRGNKDWESMNYSNIGLVYNNIKNYPEALKNYFVSLKLSEETGNKWGQALSYSYVGAAMASMNKPKEGKLWLLKGLKLANEIKTIDVIKGCYKAMAIVDSMLGDFKGAFQNYKQYIIVRDSLFSEENTRKSVETQMNYEFDKKEAATKAVQEKKDIRQRNIRNSIAAGLVGALIFLLVVFRQRNKISVARKRSDELLLNILPEEVAEELKEKGNTGAKQFDEVSVLFTDFKNFTSVSEKLSAQALVNEINYCYCEFDKIISRYRIEKIKTIGDSYMCAGGLPVANKTHAADTVTAAVEILNFMLNEKLKREKEGKTFFEIRIGIHTGPVVAGIVGLKKFAYDIWGDTVNVASRMEGSGEAGKINISGSTYELVKDKFTCTHRGKISAKNKGEIDMYFVEGNI